MDDSSRCQSPSFRFRAFFCDHGARFNHLSCLFGCMINEERLSMTFFEAACLCISPVLLACTLVRQVVPGSPHRCWRICGDAALVAARL